ncbi:MAG TPA: BtrH N-terminal domain-containing protein [Bacteroidales bacterium]|nr:BtrH N-terminal domain-containing protein [Bacteroidales bacterium]HNX06226.1 BtrH N-terminal domain-containing protein [Bacteroidales bacterium]HPB26023.1 BtrH N-terminal domain-containing protein [Bacteroidales bacterium]HPI30470.1 BtrH N-terminal domain-containing protein [Bacteroidales bacterium]HPS26189.1 BtrH N-terminal domain-containing protein [Bacteroidales bacterium]
MKMNFDHMQLSAHCESGATVNMLGYYNIKITEPMVFGIGAGYYFGHLPFLKMNYSPATTFRALPGLVFSRTCKNLGISYVRNTYRDPKKAMDELDRVLDQGIPVGVQVGVFQLPFFPPEYRMHYNMHNMVVYGKENNNYFVADSVVDGENIISYDDLMRVRYAKGAFAPHGKMYYMTKIPNAVDFKMPAIWGIKKSCHEMLDLPFWMVGIKGIKFFSKQLRKWPAKKGNKVASQYLMQAILNLEEIGTGGAGYRFIYGAFLNEAADLLQRDELKELAIDMGKAGDRWRNFSYLGARNCKNRFEPEFSYDQLAEIVMDCAEQEEKIFKKLKKIKF